jgi:hypothetical protein
LDDPKSLPIAPHETLTDLSAARVASLVPLSEMYIDANFKETQLTRIRPVHSYYPERAFMRLTAGANLCCEAPTGCKNSHSK